MKTNAFRKELQTLFNAIAPAYYMQAQDGHPTEYIVYSVEELTSLDGCISGQVEVNVMGYGTNTASVEDIADRVTADADRVQFMTDDIFAWLAYERRQTITEDDRKIIRRRLIFNFNLYERN